MVSFFWVTYPEGLIIMGDWPGSLGLIFLGDLPGLENEEGLVITGDLPISRNEASMDLNSYSLSWFCSPEILLLHIFLKFRVTYFHQNLFCQVSAMTI